QSERGLEPSDPQISDIAGEAGAAAPQWQTAHFAGSLESRLLGQPQNVSAALVWTGGNSSYSLVASRVHRWSEIAQVENRLGIKLSRPIRAVLFWLIPAISLTVVGIAGKLLSDSDAAWKPTKATAG